MTWRSGKQVFGGEQAADFRPGKAGLPRWAALARISDEPPAAHLAGGNAQFEVGLEDRAVAVAELGMGSPSGRGEGHAADPVGRVRTRLAHADLQALDRDEVEPGVADDPAAGVAAVVG